MVIKDDVKYFNFHGSWANKQIESNKRIINILQQENSHIEHNPGGRDYYPYSLYTDNYVIYYWLSKNDLTTAYNYSIEHNLVNVADKIMAYVLGGKNET